ncbi:MBL fold metallo-hydrolase [Psychroflexus aestuariivivens]|uniref:MBL fold metallo-hydrolase n=1 Tax=Psychroflexus aestuariivivens TaxID=1795040 RepID=UPI000FDC1465|nr:MBL fold metallo-hydrolase [Psychroflexus aestuariivivens]
MKKIYVLIVFAFILVGCKKDSKESKETESHKTDQVELMPVSHASFGMTWKDKLFFVDPVGDAKTYKKMGTPDYILITDIHGDHLSLETLEELGNDFTILAPEAVYKEMSESLRKLTKVISNSETFSSNDIEITAIPMYNITKERMEYHPKGRGNGYLLDLDGYRMYISGDTENISEMANLENIDLALICMNLPYTMSVDQAIESVMQFEPKKVIPYHYRGKKEGESYFSDIDHFKKTINKANPEIEVELLEWYKK